MLRMLASVALFGVLMVLGVGLSALRGPVSRTIPLSLEPNAEIRLLAGQPFSIKRRITNRGETLLRVEDIDASCGCTVVRPTEFVLPAGGTAEITIELDTTMMASKMPIGQWRPAWISLKLRGVDGSGSNTVASIKQDLQIWKACKLDQPIAVRISDGSEYVEAKIFSLALPAGAMVESIASDEPSVMAQAIGSGGQTGISILSSSEEPSGRSRLSLSIAGIANLYAAPIALNVDVLDSEARRQRTKDVELGVVSSPFSIRVPLDDLAINTDADYHTTQDFPGGVEIRVVGDDASAPLLEFSGTMREGDQSGTVRLIPASEDEFELSISIHLYVRSSRVSQ